nr:Uncharacterised protein [Enterobacter mori]CAH8250583.1 Uncharacterised protein [Enterobacter mori]
MALTILPNLHHALRLYLIVMVFAEENLLPGKGNLLKASDLKMFQSLPLLGYWLQHRM